MGSDWIDQGTKKKMKLKFHETKNIMNWLEA